MKETLKSSHKVLSLDGGGGPVNGFYFLLTIFLFLGVFKNGYFFLKKKKPKKKNKGALDKQITNGKITQHFPKSRKPEKQEHGVVCLPVAKSPFLVNSGSSSQSLVLSRDSLLYLQTPAGQSDPGSGSQRSCLHSP